MPESLYVQLPIRNCPQELDTAYIPTVNCIFLTACTLKGLTEGRRHAVTGITWPPPLSTKAVSVICKTFSVLLLRCLWCYLNAFYF